MEAKTPKSDANGRSVETGLKVLEQLESIAGFIRNQEDLSKAQRDCADWSNFTCDSPSIPLSWSPSQSRADKDVVERALGLKSRLQAVNKEITVLQDWVSKQFRDCDRRVSCLQLRAGLESLPDETLTSILGFAAADRQVDEDISAAKYVGNAIRLSHVCSRFRQLVISTSSFWSRIDNCMQPDMISMCADRSWATNSKSALEVCLILHIPPRDAEFVRSATQVVATMANRSSLCNRFHLVCIDPLMVHPTWAPHLPADNLDELGILGNPVLLPSLTELEISLPSKIVDYFGDTQQAWKILHFYATWQTPKLRSLLVKNFIPISFSGTSCLSSLSISLRSLLADPLLHGLFRDTYSTVSDTGFLKIDALRSFLSSCPCLEDFTLRFHGAPPFIPIPPAAGYTELDQIKFVTFEFSCATSVAIGAILDVIRFPSATKMSLKIANSDSEASSIIQILFPDATTFGNIKQLQLRVTHEPAFNGFLKTSFHIPFSSIPNLEQLVLGAHTDAKLLIDESYAGLLFPPLESLDLTGCINIDQDWLSDIIRRHKKIYPGRKLNIIADPSALEGLSRN